MGRKKFLLLLVMSVFYIAAHHNNISADTSTTNKYFESDVLNASSGDTISLSEDIVVDKTISIDKDLTIDLNGYSINYIGADRMFHLVEGCNNFTMKSDKSGSIVLTPQKSSINLPSHLLGLRGYIFIDTNANVTINGGNYIGETDSSCLFYSNADGTTLSLNNINVSTNNEIVNLVGGEELGFNLNVTGGTYSTTNKSTITAFKVSGSNSVMTFDGVKVNSSNGTIIEVVQATATFDNCDFLVQEARSSSNLSSVIAISNKGEATINSGTYFSAGHISYIYSTGGKVNIVNGTFSGTSNITTNALYAEVPKETSSEPSSSSKYKAIMAILAIGLFGGAAYYIKKNNIIIFEDSEAE